MKLHEYQAKAFFKNYGIPIPEGHVSSIAREAKQIAEEIGCPVVVKAQVLAEGRGTSGGILLAKSPQEAEKAASEILSKKIHGLSVRNVLIDEALSIEKEYFLLITLDREKRMPLLMMYESGTIYIETAANALFDNLDRVYIDPLIGLQRYQVRQLANRRDIQPKYLRGLTEICLGMWKLFCDMDARMVAINPLVITKDQRLLVLDGKITLDENARFRQEYLVDFRDYDVEAYGEFEARKHGLEYIKMDGNIGCLVNGAGLTMATLDCIQDNGGHPANFMDLGAGVNIDKVIAALDILLNDPQVKVVLVNIFGGMTRCDDIAYGLQAAIEKYGTEIPIIVHMGGTHAESGIKILKDLDIIFAPSMIDAVKKAVTIVGGK